MPELRVDWYQILKYHKNKFVLYGHGQPSTHIMDWAGCNFHHGRLTGTGYDKSEGLDWKVVDVLSPVFDSINDAMDWLVEFQKSGITGVDIAGHFSGDNGCEKCAHRKVKEFTYKGRIFDGDCIQDYHLKKFIKEGGLYE